MLNLEEDVMMKTSKERRKESTYNQYFSSRGGVYMSSVGVVYSIWAVSTCILNEELMK